MICFIENKNLQDYHRIFQFYAAYFILHFLLRTFVKRIGEPLFLLTVHHKLIFRGALKKALMVSENRSYQTNTLQKSSLAH